MPVDFEDPTQPNSGEIASLSFAKSLGQNPNVGTLAKLQPTKPTWYSPFSALNRVASMGASTTPRMTKIKVPYQAPVFPETIATPLPFEGTKAYQSPPASQTKGKAWDSAAAALSAQGSQINLGNVVPYSIERTTALAHALNDDILSNTPMAPVGTASTAGLDAFMTGLSAFSNAVGPVINAAPEGYRDGALLARAKAYRLLIQHPAQSGVRLDTAFKTAFAGAHSQNDYQRALDYLHAVGWSGGSAQTALSSIDLPESVKAGIAADPSLSDDALWALIDKAPEGKQWTYSGGPAGLLGNLFMTGVSYAPEMMLGGAAFKAVKAGGGIAAQALGGAAKAWTIAAKIQAAAAAAGLGTMALTTVGDAIAREQGNQAFVDWFDKVNQTHPISDNPNVQLVTSFAVNPFAPAAAVLRKGILPLARGMGNVAVNAVLGDHLTRLYTSDTLVNDILGRTFGKAPAEMATYIGEGKPFANRGQAADHVLQGAADAAWDDIPLVDREVFARTHPDGIDRTKAFLETYGNEVAAVLKDHPERIVARLRDQAWNYHHYDGPFDPDLAMSNLVDYRTAKESSYVLRQQMGGAVIGYPDYLSPEAAVNVRAALDELPADQPVPIGWLDAQKEAYPALNKLTAGLYEPGTAAVPRSVVEEVLNRGEQAYQGAMKRNPFRVKTGTDPVLRPNATAQDVASAVGTTPGIVRDLQRVPDAATDYQALRGFVAEKMGVDPAAVATMSDEAVFEKASTYLANTTDPWYRTGETVAAAERSQANLAQQMARAQATGDLTRYKALSREIADLRETLRLANDPIVPFADTVKYATRTAKADAREAAMVQAAARKVDAQARLRNLAALDDYARTLSPELPDPLSLVRQTREGTWGWAGGAPAMPPGLYARVLSYLQGLNPAQLREAIGDRLAVQVGEGAHYLGTVGDHGLYQIAEKLAAREEFLSTLRGYARRTKKGSFASVNEARILDDYLSRAGEMIDDDAAAQSLAVGMGHDPNRVYTGEMVTADLGRMAEQRADIIGGRSTSVLERAAARSVPENYVRAIEGELADGSVVYDPLFETVTHPDNITRLDAAIKAGAWETATDIVKSDPVLMSRLENIAIGTGENGYTLGRPATAGEMMFTDRLAREPLQSPLSAYEVLTGKEPQWGIVQRLVPDGFEPPIPGVIQAATPLDEAILSGDGSAIGDLVGQLGLVEGRAIPPKPIPNVPESTANALIRRPPLHPSTEALRKLGSVGADITVPPDAAILADPANKVGLDVLSLMNWGTPGVPPASVGTVASLLRRIENGNGTNMGLGPGLLAEGQRVANEILDRAVSQAQRAVFEPGVMMHGLNPYTFGDDIGELGRSLVHRTVDGRPLIETDATGLGIQYGLKKPAQGKLYMELEQVPGLSEEFLTGHFEPFRERLGTAQLRQMWGMTFGPRANIDVVAENKARFTQAVMAKGGSPELATAIWDAWKQTTKESQDMQVEILKSGEHIVHRRGPITWETEAPGEHVGTRKGNPYKADIRNISNKELDGLAHIAVNDFYAKDKMAPPGGAPMSLKAADFSTMFREATSFTRRNLAGHFGTLGDAAASAYGLVAHNPLVTTMYPIFRFKLDLRLHAMNAVEGAALYAGRAGLRPGELPEGLFGMTRDYITGLSRDGMSNTGYPFSQTRDSWLYRGIKKEQMPALRESLAKSMREEPILFERAVKELGTQDPALRQMIADMGDTPDGWIKALNEWYGKLMDSTDADATIEQAVASEAARTPALAEVYGIVAQRNKQLLDDWRGLMYGNPNRSNVERFANNYLVYWPISYQIKATKWWMKVLFDRAGGLPTNAGGAYLLNNVLAMHQKALATDPEYNQFIANHSTILFAAQMLFPLDPTNPLSASLSPGLRDLMFGRTKMVSQIGPVYTITKLVPQVTGEVYRDFEGTPGFAQAYPMLVGQKAPTGAAAKAAAAIDTSAIDISRFGQ